MVPLEPGFHHFAAFSGSARSSSVPGGQGGQGRSSGSTNRVPPIRGNDPCMNKQVYVVMQAYEVDSATTDRAAADARVALLIAKGLPARVVSLPLDELDQAAIDRTA
jgi:hypothetical protein